MAIVDSRHAWAPEDGPGQRPPLEGPTFAIERAPVWVDPDLERLAAGKAPEAERFVPELEDLEA